MRSAGETAFLEMKAIISSSLMSESALEPLGKVKIFIYPSAKRAAETDVRSFRIHAPNLVIPSAITAGVRFTVGLGTLEQGSTCARAPDPDLPGEGAGVDEGTGLGFFDS